MAKSKVLLSTEDPISRDDLSAFLKDLAEKVSSGNVMLRQGDDEINLSIPSNLVLEVKVEEEEKKRKGTKHTLELEFEWYDQADGGGPLELG
jgi:amphi-Trp domain-containing protein